MSVGLVLTALAFGAAGCGGEDEPQPKAEDIPPRAVAIVGNADISAGELERSVSAMRRAQTAHEDGSRLTTAQLERQALSNLLRAAALEQEAASRGIRVTPAEALERWKAAAGSQFRTERALRRFLGGQTKRDVVEQLRLQLLTERVHADVSEQAGGGKDGAKAVAEFQREFERRWRDRTVCRAGREDASLCPSDEK